ncbi:MAG: hypothetical protein ACOYN0_10485 [Phycisphaerales bacterium]
MHDVNWQDPKLIAGIVLGVGAIGLTLYNCVGSKPGVPLVPAEVTQQRMYAIAHRTLNALQSGAVPKALTELPKLPNVDESTTDGWGAEITFSLADAPNKSKSATLQSAGADRAMGTADDIRCTAEFRFEPGPGYDVYVQGPVDFVLPGTP